MLNKKKAYGASLPCTSPAGGLNIVDNNDTFRGLEDQAGPSNVVDTRDSLIGLEDLAHGTNGNGIPFILVDGAACTTRSSLDLALRGVEQKRMEQVLNDVADSDLPQLEDTEPPPELDKDINLNSEALARQRAVEEEQRFQRDISDLTFWSPEDYDAYRTPTTTGGSNTSIQQAIQKLEQLRGLSKQVSLPDTGTPVDKLPMRPSIQRQATFDIKRKNEGDKGFGSSTAGAATSKKPQSLKTPFRGGIPSLSSRKPVTARGRQLANSIGDLLLEFHSLQENKSELLEGSSHSYMVTIRPSNGATNCSIVPVPNPKFNNLSSSPNQSSSNTISYPKRTRSELNSSRVVGRNSAPPAPGKQASPVTFSNERCRSPFLHKTTSSFISFPAPVRHNQGRKRD